MTVAMSTEGLTSAISTVLARAVCKLIHGQSNWGACVNCLSWAKYFGAPALAGPILAEVTAERERILAEIEAWCGNVEDQFAASDYSESLPLS
jgi:hypothetical protein